MLERILPDRLKFGDTIGIVSLSSPLACHFPRRFERGISELNRLGFKIKCGNYVRSAYSHTSGTVEQRLSDLHAMFADTDVKMIMSTIGGYTSNHLLEGLDFDLIRTNPKLFIGYSDTTALQIAIWQRTRLTVIMGPAMMPQFGEFGGVHEYTWHWFHRVLMEVSPIGEITPTPYRIDERLAWDREDNRSRSFIPNSSPRTVRPGRVEGILLPANIDTLLVLAGTQFWPNLEGVILCLEESDSSSQAQLDRSLTHLRQLGVFSKIAGLVFGRVPSNLNLSGHSLDLIILQATCNYDFPIIADLAFGHTDPMLSLPFGVRARLEAISHPTLYLLEEAVTIR